MTSNIQYQTRKKINTKALLALYSDANWTNYTKDPQRLESALNQSLHVISAWNQDELIGLIRAVGDGLTILYIQDILVKKAWKRRGIGRTLLNQMIEHFPEVRQKVLLTDENPESRGFYEAMGFQSCDQGTVVAFAKFTNP